ALFIVAFGCAATPVFAQSDDVIKVDTDLVLLDVSVTDKQEQPVRGLKPGDFKIYEDGEERSVAFLNAEKTTDYNRPLAIVFTLDISGSIKSSELEQLRSSVRTFATHLSNRSSVFGVMTFGNKVKLKQSFTNDVGKLDRVFDDLVHDTSGLSTHAYDAVDDAIRQLVRHAPQSKEKRLIKRAVILITDGFPVGDTVAPETVIERANRADVSIYSVTLPSYSRLTASYDNRPLLTPLDVTGLVDKTGGSNFYISANDYERLFTALAEDVSSSYAIGYYPPDMKKRDGRYHTIRVETRAGTIRQSRPGYTANSK
ncbi:MAG: VWA domain-containing protein, partial [Pyrinomonadaceae bacterium]